MGAAGTQGPTAKKIVVRGARKVRFLLVDGRRTGRVGHALIVAVFCLTDDWLEGHHHWVPLRKRGPRPELSDSEVLTIETVGEFLGIDTDKGLFVYFHRHYTEWFPALRKVHCTTFVR